MKELNKVVRAIGSFIITCIVFAIPIATAFMLHTKHNELMNFFAFVLLIASIIEFIFVLGYFYTNSERD